MSSKKVYHYPDIRKEILEAVDMIANPVVSTLSPRGSNVVYQDSNGNPEVTNDGVTIAKNISSKNEIHNTIIDIIKHSSLKTNSEAGDGTTTSILLSQVLIKEGFKLIDEGMNPIELKRRLEGVCEVLLSNIKKGVITIPTSGDREMHRIAVISANNDDVIAKDVVEIVKFAGDLGMVFIEPNNKLETELVKEPGFRIEQGMFSPELRNNPSQFSATYKDVPVLLTDKRIYYREEAETILSVAIKAGYKNIVVIARDFIGEAVNTFLANHNKTINVLLIKDPLVTEKNSESLDDLAIYINGHVVKEKNGRLVDNITEKDFTVVNQVYADPVKTIITPKIVSSIKLDALVDSLKVELEKDKDNKEIKRRLACLTAGTINVKVGGATPIEQTEKIYRYEDAINATRAAVKDGYLVGGGIALLNSYNEEDIEPEMRTLAKRFTEASVRQIAKNCGKYEDHVLQTIRSGKGKNYGYNAMSDTYGDLLKDGVIDPYKVTEMAIRNSVSIANVILSSKYLIVNDTEEKNESK